MLLWVACRERYSLFRRINVCDEPRGQGGTDTSREPQQEPAYEDRTNVLAP